MSVKVFFNNSCKICKMEIDHYKKYSDNSLDWVDITNNDEAISLTSKTQAELLRRLHVIHDGKVIGGAKAFLIIWSSIPKYNFLYKILSKKPLFILFHYAYEIAAYFLFLKNKNQLKWKNLTYLLNYASFVKGLLIGEKNGNLTGIKLNIVQKGALVKEYEFRKIQMEK